MFLLLDLTKYINYCKNIHAHPVHRPNGQPFVNGSHAARHVVLLGHNRIKENIDKVPSFSHTPYFSGEFPW